MIRLLLKKQICMEVGCMLGNIIVGVCIVALCVGMIYGIYMAYWGVWNERQYNDKINIWWDVFNNCIVLVECI